MSVRSWLNKPSRRPSRGEDLTFTGNQKDASASERGDGATSQKGEALANMNDSLEDTDDSTDNDDDFLDHFPIVRDSKCSPAPNDSDDSFQSITGNLTDYVYPNDSMRDSQIILGEKTYRRIVEADVKFINEESSRLLDIMVKPQTSTSTSETPPSSWVPTIVKVRKTVQAVEVSPLPGVATALTLKPMERTQSDGFQSVVERVLGVFHEGSPLVDMHGRILGLDVSDGLRLILRRDTQGDPNLDVVNGNEFNDVITQFNASTQPPLSHRPFEPTTDSRTETKDTNTGASAGSRFHNDNRRYKSERKDQAGRPTSSNVSIQGNMSDRGPASAPKGTFTHSSTSRPEPAILDTSLKTMNTTGTNIHINRSAQIARKRIKTRKIIKGYITDDKGDEDSGASTSVSASDAGLHNSNSDLDDVASVGKGQWTDENQVRGWENSVTQQQITKEGWPGISHGPGIQVAHSTQPPLLPVSQPFRTNVLNPAPAVNGNNQWREWVWDNFQAFLCSFTLYGELCWAARTLGYLEHLRQAHDPSNSDSGESTSSAFSIFRGWGSFPPVTIFHPDAYLSRRNTASTLASRFGGSLAADLSSLPGDQVQLLEKEVCGRVEDIYEKLQKEWTYLTALLVALTSIGTAIFAIPSDSFFAVKPSTRPLVATLCLCAVAGLVCVIWNFWRYGWASGVGFSAQNDNGSNGSADAHRFMSRAMDINGTYVTLALLSRIPAGAALVSVLTLMIFFCLVTYGAAGKIVWTVVTIVAIAVCGQYVAWGARKAFRTITWGIGGIAEGAWACLRCAVAWTRGIQVIAPKVEAERSGDQHNSQ
ncbi:hypothetical protein PQX77_020034 [Marasmius sp. AFHP31]|nr:hypothetical protein PQX77_020034 [Marasmius sp. AFHP31]